MIMQIGRYLYFETEADYDEQVGSNYYAGRSIEKPKNFPAYLRYVESPDPHFCGIWAKCQRKEVIAALAVKIADCELDLKELKNLMNRIKKKT